MITCRQSSIGMEFEHADSNASSSDGLCDDTITCRQWSIGMKFQRVQSGTSTSAGLAGDTITHRQSSIGMELQRADSSASTSEGELETNSTMFSIEMLDTAEDARRRVHFADEVP